MEGNNIMLDLETMGSGSNSAITAIGAVRFGDTVTDKFYQVVSLQSSVDAGLSMDVSTVLWWMQQSDEARSIYYQHTAVPLKEMLMNFIAWIGEDARVWGCGAAFDNAILSNAYRKTGIRQPWNFWNDMCYRTIKNLNPEVALVRVGTHHNAVDDAESQARHLLKILA